MKIGELKKS